MFKNRFMTYEEVMSSFASSVDGILNDIDVKMKELRMNNDDDDTTKAFYTKKIIDKWFLNKGDL